MRIFFWWALLAEFRKILAWKEQNNNKEEQKMMKTKTARFLFSLFGWKKRGIVGKKRDKKNRRNFGISVFTRRSIEFFCKENRNEKKNLIQFSNVGVLSFLDVYQIKTNLKTNFEWLFRNEKGVLRKSINFKLSSFFMGMKNKLHCTWWKVAFSWQLMIVINFHRVSLF